MPASPLPLTRDLVLVGGGHAHALVLRKWGMSPLAGVRLTLINPGPSAPYSGMLPGFVAGHYARAALDIDLVQLARFAGARLVLGAAGGLDPIRKRISVPGRPDICYDIASIDIGVTSAMPDLPGFLDHAVPAKPLDGFASAWEAFCRQDGPARIACIGGGIAGVELILAMAHALRQQGRLAAATLMDSDAALSALAPQSQPRLRAALDRYGVTLLEQAHVTHLEAGAIHLEGGRVIHSDFTLGAAGARAYGWLESTGLRQHEGALVVSPELQTSDPDVFAVGDCAHMAHAPRPKAGVFAVRQAPVLCDNLKAALLGGNMRRYQPQEDYLKLVSMGRKSALAERNGRSFSGPLLWRWKDHIDRKFMAQFARLPVTSATVSPPEKAATPDPSSPGSALDQFRGAARPDVAVQPDGTAAQLTAGDAMQLISARHLPAISADPVTLTRIAVQHALNPLWALGAEPQAATLLLTQPQQSAALQQRQYAEIMEVADQEMKTAGATIASVQTSPGAALSLGVSLTGLCPRTPVTLAGAQSGDHLILTKPLGSGVLLAGAASGQARGRWVTAALDLMEQSQQRASEILREAARAMCDVAERGLLGHVQAICQQSERGAELRFDAIPKMRGAAELAETGLRAPGFDANAVRLPEIASTGPRALLFDPQTSGGLLAAVPADLSEMLLHRLRAHGYRAAEIGRITPQGDGILLR
ncbi:selenide, water dikinase SelD [Phaeobacter sp. HF9A]|uniref:selenide, water dikinase SelD n=1 Tax=Phaeobacter sp. HF9A TaxID=2721561 RepID=UPI001430690C|nr:selenide, water dikinase SelD [Phaeobacter sp. HF9A]NIZ14829.1 selenide, water dikinase SelD [Phaeobacter sp. HF9A]